MLVEALQIITGIENTNSKYRISVPTVLYSGSVNHFTFLFYFFFTVFIERSRKEIAMVVSRSTILVKTKISRQLSDRILCNILQTVKGSQMMNVFGYSLTFPLVPPFGSYWWF